MTKYLLYAPGTHGIGHFRRLSAILKKLWTRKDKYLLITPSNYASAIKEKHFSGIRILNVQNIKDVLNATEKFIPNILITDTFPLGINGELASIVRNKSIKKVLILRQRHDRIKLKALTNQINLYDLVLLPYKKGSEWEKKLQSSDKIFPVGEIFNPQTTGRAVTRRKFSVPKDSLLVVATCGGGGTIDANKITPILFDVLKKIAKKSKVHVIFSMGPMNRINIRYSAKNFRVYKYVPNLQNLIAAADLVICFGGYNTVNEVVAARVPAIILPSRTKTDNQLTRAKIVKKIIRSDFIAADNLTVNKLYLKANKFLSLKGLRLNKKDTSAKGAEIAAQMIKQITNGIEKRA